MTQRKDNGPRRRRQTEVENAILAASDKDVAYAAGLFDGEGCVTIGKNRAYTPPTYALAVFVAMTDRAALTWLARTFGGAVSTSVQYRPGERALSRWRAFGWIACAFLKRIAPHLKVKKEQAAIGIKFQEETKVYGYGPGAHHIRRSSDIRAKEAEYFDEMKRLKTIVVEEGVA